MTGALTRRLCVQFSGVRFPFYIGVLRKRRRTDRVGGVHPRPHSRRHIELLDRGPRLLAIPTRSATTPGEALPGVRTLGLLPG